MKPGPSRKPQLVFCTRCGHPVRDPALACKMCHASVPTHRCGHCYHRNIGNAPECAACGVALGLEPVGTRDRRSCTLCAVAFESVPVRDSSLLDCPSCGGQFIGHALFNALVAERREASIPTPNPIRANPMVRPIRYVQCPICAQHMHRKNYGKTSGVILDLCHQDGIWFDRGELPLILRFVEQGGLDRAEAIAVREEKEREHRARVERAARRHDINRPVTRIGAELELNEALLSVLAETLFG